ncbi:MAG: hypothetical protein NC293_03015 [Roseburia sp.]|nr:hypothetical protein [Roseburia sp.]
MKKFNGELVKQIRAENEMQKEQLLLKEKYGVDQEDVVIVEKSNLVKFLIRTLARVIRIAANILIFFLSVAGLAALIYPASRMELFRQTYNMYQELVRFLPFI